MIPGGDQGLAPWRVLTKVRLGAISRIFACACWAGFGKMTVSDLKGGRYPYWRPWERSWSGAGVGLTIPRSSVTSVSSISGAPGPRDFGILGWQSCGCVHSEEPLGHLFQPPCSALAFRCPAFLLLTWGVSWSWGRSGGVSEL